MECSVLTFLGPDYNLGGDQGAGRSPPKIQELESGQGFKALDPILRAPGRFSFTQSPPPPQAQRQLLRESKGGTPLRATPGAPQAEAGTTRSWVRASADPEDTLQTPHQQAREP